ncbi:hypothetical protein RJ641_010990 [Dillenia turbinata]|uniref:J domain-containing protein n=1 Tax=Dillenia turbinata TaxID=194707 RepID=A0AAN8V2Z8_9MAGN
MENLSHSSLSRNQKTKHYNGNNGFSRTVYDDVFGGLPKFGIPNFTPRLEDYTEIFSSFSSSKASSIPVLDLPLTTTNDNFSFDVRSSHFNYSEVFGGFDDAFDFAVPYQELFARSMGEQESSEEACLVKYEAPGSMSVGFSRWTPAETESLSEESDPSITSEANPCLSDVKNQQQFEGTRQFNISYHQTTQISNKDIPNGTKHVAQVHAIPGFSYIVDGTAASRDVKVMNPASVVTDDTNLGKELGKEKMGRKEVKKTVTNSGKSNAGSETSSGDLRPQNTCADDGAQPGQMFVTISEISLKTQPSQLPPPRRPPPVLAVKEGGYAFEGTAREISPPFLDVDIDASSSAAASAAAMKDAMEKAQAKLKSAKELMERKKGGHQSRSKLLSKDGDKDKDGKASGFANGSYIRKEVLKQGMTEGGENGSEVFAEERSLDSMQEAKVQVLTIKNAERKHHRRHWSFQESLEANAAGEWKEATQYFELVRMDQSKKVLGHETSERIFVQNSKSHKQTETQKKVSAREMFELERESNVPMEAATEAHEHGRNKKLPEATKRAFEWQKRNGRSKVQQVPGWLEDDGQKVKGIDQIWEQAENTQNVMVLEEIAMANKKSAKAHKSGSQGDPVNVQKKDTTSALEAVEFKEDVQCIQEAYGGRFKGRRSKEIHGSKEAENSLEETFEQEEDRRFKEVVKEADHEKRRKEAYEQEENVKRLEEAFKKEENARRQNEACRREEKERILKEACEREDKEKRLKEAREEEETMKKMKETREREEKEWRLKEAREKEENERRLEEALKREENERRLKEAYEREKNDKRRKEACEREENERRVKEAREREEIERRLREAREREETEKRLREAYERQENERRLKDERRLKEAREREENERRLREAREREETEKRLREAREREENDRRVREACEREENERRLKEARKREENEKRLKEAREREENEKRIKEAHEREENEKRLREGSERQENERRLKEAREREENERRVREACEREENERRLKEAREREENEKRLKEACEREENEKRTKEVQEREENEKRLREAHERKENEKRQKEAIKEEQNARKQREAKERKESEKKISDAHEREENEKRLKQAFELEEIKRRLKDVSESEMCEKFAQRESNHAERDNHGKKLNGAQEIDIAVEGECLHLSDEASNLDGNKNVRATKVWCKHEDKIGKLETTKQACKEKDQKVESGDTENAREAAEVVSGYAVGSSRVSSVVVDDMGPGENEVITEDATESLVLNKNISRGAGIVYNWMHVKEDKKGEKEEKVNRDQELEKERLRKLEEEREREREREKDRMAVDRASIEARERTFAEARARAAVERATAEARQRAMTDARERLEKACAEAREKSFSEKASAESRLRAERIAVERATAEAREHAFEKTMAERAVSEAREHVERSVSDKFSASTRDNGMRYASSSDLPDLQLRSTSFGGSRYPYTSINGDHTFSVASNNTEKFEGVEGESAQRCKARLERHQRTVERAAKALAEKNMRDLLAQREQAERNRLAETLDADVKRWSSGKEGNLRALLSTLQYILGPDSGWQPIPLTEVITSAAVKKAYRKATLCVHPDKLQQRGASIQQKYICEKVFDLLKEAWNKFNSEER